MEPQTFRIFFWQKCMPLLAAPFFGAMLWFSPLTDSWSRNVWIGVGVLAAGAVLTYLYKAWKKAEVTLAGDGLTLFTGEWRTYALEDLLKVKQVGKYRVRMCYDAHVDGKHRHVSLDVLNSDGFVDALLDRYESVCGHELPEPQDHAEAA